MKWKEFRKMIKQCRRISNQMGRRYKHETMFWLEPQVTFSKRKIDLVFDLNPFCCNLKTGMYLHSGRNVLTGRYCNVPNLKTCNEVNKR